MRPQITPSTRPPAAHRRIPRPTTRRHSGRGLAALATLGLLVAGPLAACSSASHDAATSRPAAEARDVAAPFDDAADAGVDDADAPADVVGSSTAGSGFDIGTVGREVAIEMRVTMRSDDIRATVAGITSAASTRGGGVASSEIEFGTASRPGWATLVIKVPPRGIDAVLERLDQLGEVIAVGQDALDVTDQLVDLEVRIRNATQSVDRVRALLADASDLREVIDLESELTRRQTDLERLLATQRSLQERVALATITIDVLADDVAVEPVDDPDPGLLDGLRTGWEGFVGVLFALVYGAAVLAPVLVLTTAAVVIAWMATRRRRAGGPTPDDRPAAPAVPPGAATADDQTAVTVGDRTTPAP